MAVAGAFDRAYIRERAVRLYDMAAVGRQYEYAFRTILDVHNGANGWYAPSSAIDVTLSSADVTLSSADVTLSSAP
jgi:hypothetical protein